MNKKQIETIAKQYLNFIIVTPLFESRRLNSSEIEFISEGLLKIKGKMNKGDVFIQTKDVKIIRGHLKDDN